jgi:hypothetical protein
LRKALMTLKAQAIEMENKWLANSLLHEQQVGLKARTSRSEFSLQGVNDQDTEPPSVSGASTPPNVYNQATTCSKLRSSFNNATWKSNLEAEMQLLAQISRSSPKIRRCA